MTLKHWGRSVALVMAGLAGIVWAAEGPAVDAKGVRVFSKVPAPGVHPRVWFSPEDVPEIRHRIYETECGKQMAQRIIAGMRRELNAHTDPFLALEGKALDRDTVKKLVINREHTCQVWGVCAVDAYLRNDVEQKDRLIRTAVQHCRLVMAAREFFPDEPLWKLGQPGAMNWNLQSEFTVGGEGIAMIYDFLYNDMTDAQRGAIRKMISEVLAGRRAKGMGDPRTKLFSNWVPLHGDIVTLSLAIEGEEGYRPEIYKEYLATMDGWLSVAISPQGANHEDGYVYYALRGGLPSMIAMARRGDNLFHHPHFKEIFHWMTHFEPVNAGPDGYSNVFVLTKYAFPRDPLINSFYARRYGTDYKNHIDHQNHIGQVLFGMDYFGDPATVKDPASLGLEKSIFDSRRGMQIARNGWSSNDLQFAIAARGDMFLVGHAAVDNGAFRLNARGRQWVRLHVGDKVGSFSSKDFSLVHVDGVAEGMKPPQTKVLQVKDAGMATLFAADLTYAYNWTWYYGWPKPQDFPAWPPEGWEIEKNDPYELGWPMADSWLPHDLSNQPDLGFDGTWQLKKRHNSVRHAYRTALTIRGAMPYVLIVDDVKQDDQARLYEWYMQTALDVELDSLQLQDVVLRGKEDLLPGAKPAAGSPRLLVRFLAPFQDMAPTQGKLFYDRPNFLQDARLESHMFAAGAKNPGKRLVVPSRGTAGDFKVLLFPFGLGDSLPVTEWNDARDQLTVKTAGQTDVFRFVKAADGRTLVTLSRNGKEVF